MTVHARVTSVRNNTVEIRHLFHDEDGPTGLYLDELSLRVLASARTLVGVKTGLLLSTIRRESGHGPTGPYRDIVAGRSGLTPYLGFHHDGTVPHVIAARRKKTLRFIWHGRVVYRRMVHHPGTKGTFFLTRALDAIR